MPKPTLFALVDCNNFYASCERVFVPRLRGKPIVVLSNNDGCIVARSNEAKALGVKMGIAFFEARDLIRKNNVLVFSSNYALYGEMSERVFSVLSQFTPEMEVYSIDEAFLNLAGFSRHDLTAYGQEMRATVRRWTGIPISVGIAETKVLAKIANRIAKRSLDAEGVWDLTIPGRCEQALATTAIGDVWGIGHKSAKRLMAGGITSAKKLSEVDDIWIRKRMGIIGLRLVQELRGLSCLSLDLCPPPRKGITCSRSFGRPITAIEEMKEAVTAYVSRAAARLRNQGSAVKCLTVYLMTSQATMATSRNIWEATIELPVATDDTVELIRFASRGVEKTFREGLSYRKAGVILTDLVPASQVQSDIFDAADRERSERLMSVIDRVNRRLGSRTVRFAAQGQAQPWSMKCEMRSPGYTTDWRELAEARA